MTSSPRVVVVGGGFAGLYLAKALAHRAVRVTLLDRTNHHLFQPLLYQVATAALSPADIASPIRGILRGAENVEVLLGEAVRIDPGAATVRLRDGTALGYDYLVLATGTHHAYFGHPEWEQWAPGLKSLEDGLEIRRRVLLAFERAERETDPALRQRLLSFVVVGGGPTGVELAGALAEMRRYALRRDFRRIDSRQATVTLVEAGPRLLPAYPDGLSARAGEVLARLGVGVRLGTTVTGVADGTVTTATGEIQAGTVIWAAGNQADPLLASLGVPLDRQGRAIVEPDCSIPGYSKVFVLGDAAAYRHQNGYPLLPGVCQVAMQMGEHAARVVLADQAGRPRPVFRYRDKGQLAVIGRGRAVADLGRVRVGGFVAWLLWIFVHIFFLIGFRNRVLVLFQWAWSYVTLQRGTRLITGAWRPGADPS